jgi:RND family efflux transporter MFP subunit
VLCCALALVLAGCGPGDLPSSKKQGAKFAGPPKPVVVATVEKVPMERVVVAIGSLAALEQSTLSVKVPGRVQSTPVDLGSRVRRGELIAQIERQDYELKLRQSDALLAQARARLGLPLEGSNETVDPERTSTVRQAKAVFDEATKTLERIRKLYERKISSESDLESAQASYDVAANKFQTALEDVRDRIAQLAQRRAEVEIARQQLQDTEIRAPFDGVVQERRANIGEYLNVGAPVVTLVRTDPLRLRVEVPERDAPGVHSGQRVRLSIEGDTNVYAGEITRLSPAISENTRMLIAEADVKNTGTLRPGSFARAEIVVEEQQPTTAIPTDALVVFAGIEKVFIVREGKAVEKNVSTGRRTADFIELSKEVKPGDLVVLNPGGLLNGQPVVVEQSAVGGQRSAKKKQASTAGGKRGSGSDVPGKKDTGP